MVFPPGSCSAFPQSCDPGTWEAPALVTPQLFLRAGLCPTASPQLVRLGGGSRSTEDQKMALISTQLPPAPGCRAAASSQPLPRKIARSSAGDEPLREQRTRTLKSQDCFPQIQQTHLHVIAEWFAYICIHPRPHPLPPYTHSSAKTKYLSCSIDVPKPDSIHFKCFQDLIRGLQGEGG